MAVEYFLKIDGVKGESTKTNHVDEIELLSFSFGEDNAGTHSIGGGGGAGKVQMQDFHFTMNLNKASPALFLLCANGKHIPSAILTARKAGGEQKDYYIVTFTDLLISSYTTSGHADSNHLPIDTCAFNFAKIEIDYKVQDKSGNVATVGKVGYDLKQMK
ncbi:MAG TPA: type VI secretion system tube protein Hcp [Gemmatales bacterium]|nr:type VI secretion system tube protein Hcp [Gemmatales bacterium]